jgi:splicing factor 3B subunit 3
MIRIEALDYAAPFCSPQCQEGIVSLSHQRLIILAAKIGEVFDQVTIPLRYTPRRMVLHGKTRRIVIVESDQRVVLDQYKGKAGDNALEDQEMGYTKGTKGTWASCLQIFDPTQKALIATVDIDVNEAALSACSAVFTGHEGQYLVVGTARDSGNEGCKGISSGFLYTYLLLEGKDVPLELTHRTPVEETPYCVASYKGKLLVGIGNKLRLYEYGKKKLIKKVDYKNFQTNVANIQTIGDRIFVSDSTSSFQVLTYKPQENIFVSIAEDSLPRWVTTATLLDYTTIVASDKFENVFVMRLPQSTVNFFWESLL